MSVLSAAKSYLGNYLPKVPQGKASQSFHLLRDKRHCFIFASVPACLDDYCTVAPQCPSLAPSDWIRPLPSQSAEQLAVATLLSVPADIGSPANESRHCKQDSGTEQHLPGLFGAGFSFGGWLVRAHTGNLAALLGRLGLVEWRVAGVLTRPHVPHHQFYYGRRL